MLKKHSGWFLFYPVLSMRVVHKICPVCQTTFEAKRRNQVYCTDDCRADANNDKLKAKYHNMKTLEKDKEISDQYKGKFVNAIRIVVIEYDEKDKNEMITFEGKRFKKEAVSPELISILGLTFKKESLQDGSRVAVYIPQESAIYLLDNFSHYSSNQEVTYRLMKKKKVTSS